MARDYAKKRAPVNRRPKTNRRKTNSSSRRAAERISGWRLYGLGVLSGVFLSFLLYLGTLPPNSGASGQLAQGDAHPTEVEPPKPHFDFYTLLPEQTMDIRAEEVEVTPNRISQPQTFYLLQAGAFRQRNDAESRRAELLLLNLEPKIEETNGDSGRWYRIYLGPFQSKSKLNKARSLTAAQNIDTLLLKRGRT